MDKIKLKKVFDKIKEKAHLDYAIINTDKYGDCNTCVNDSLCSEFGVDSKGIYAKHWEYGMNAGESWDELNWLYIAHDITENQSDILVNIFKENGYKISPEHYDPLRVFEIKEG